MSCRNCNLLKFKLFWNKELWYTNLEFHYFYFKITLDSRIAVGSGYTLERLSTLLTYILLGSELSRQELSWWLLRDLRDWRLSFTLILSCRADIWELFSCWWAEVSKDDSNLLLQTHRHHSSTWLLRKAPASNYKINTLMEILVSQALKQRPPANISKC